MASLDDVITVGNSLNKNISQLIQSMGTNSNALVSAINGVSVKSLVEPGFSWSFDTNTTDSDPGNGKFKFNNATIANATELYIDNVDIFGSNVAAWLDSFDESSSTIKGTIKFQLVDNPAVFAMFTMSGSVVNATGYRKITLASYLTGNGAFSAGNVIAVLFQPSGTALGVLTPEQFGAVGNNSTDDAAAIQAMFDSVGTVATSIKYTPTVFWFDPSKIYRIGTTVKVQQYGCWLFGNGAGLRMTGTGPALMVDHANSINNVEGVRIDGFHISTPTGTTNHGIVARSAPQLRITNNKFKDFSSIGTLVNAVGGTAIRLEGCVAYLIEDNEIDGAGVHGVHVKAYNKTWAGGGGPVVAESQGGIIIQNRVYYTDSIGILVSEGGGHKIVRNDIESCNDGVEVRSSYDFSVEDNYFEVNTADIQIRNLTELVPPREILGGRVIGNQCESTTGISLVDGDDIIVLYNRISGSSSIAAACNRTLWGPQVEQTGGLTDSSATSLVLSNANGNLQIAASTATPAGGSAKAALLFGTTAGFGIYYGSGAPTVSAAQGSLYIRSNGSSTSTRLYINTNGSTTWTSVTTAA